MSRAVRIAILSLALMLVSPIVSSQLTATETCLNCYWTMVPDPDGGDPFFSGGMCLSLSDVGWKNCIDGINGCGALDTECRCRV